MTEGPDCRYHLIPFAEAALDYVSLNLEETKVTRRNLFLFTTVSGIACMALATAASATVPRAFVSTQGLDSNPCSATQPCRSFNQALTVVQPGGEIIVQDSGGYSTGFTITQSVTIDAGGSNASVISLGSGDLCSINAGPTDRVVLRGITFHGAGLGANAINCTQVGSLYVERCSISEFTTAGVLVQNGGNVFVSNDDFRSCPTGVFLQANGATDANLVAQHSRFAECFSSAITAYAVHGAGNATGWVSDCTASFGSIGFTAISNDLANAQLTLDNCRAVGNNFSGLFAKTFNSGSAIIRMANCVITQNVAGIIADSPGGGLASVIGTSPGSNLVAGNDTDGSVASIVTLQ